MNRNTSVTAAAGRAASRQLCTFHVGELFFGVDVTSVQEVIRYQPMTPVPLASSVVSGLINLRGQIVTAIDLRRLLALPARDATALPLNVVIRGAESTVSLLVDEIGDVVNVAESTFEPPPQTLDSPASELVDGVYKLPERLILLLHTDVATRGSHVQANERDSHGHR